MKRIIIYFISALIVFSLISCKKKECHGLVHKNPPALSDTGYNTCEAIYYNFYTYAGDGEGYDLVCQMAYSPIKAYGYIHVYRRPDRNYYSLCDEPMLSNYEYPENEYPEIELMIDNVGTLSSFDIDYTKKYHITGYLGFNEHPYHANNFGACMTFIPKILYIDSCYLE